MPKAVLAAQWDGDPYGIRTHVTAVKGPCLNHLTNGPFGFTLSGTGEMPGISPVCGSGTWI